MQGLERGQGELMQGTRVCIKCDEGGTGLGSGETCRHLGLRT